MIAPPRKLAPTQMNVQLHFVISDIVGVTGPVTVRAIFAGERDAAILVELRERRIEAEETKVAAALQGNRRDVHLVALKQALALFDTYTAQVNKCGGKLQQLLGALKNHELPGAGQGETKRGRVRRSTGCRYV